MTDYVTDPALLAKLNGKDVGYVTDPTLLAKLYQGAEPQEMRQSAPQPQAGALGGREFLSTPDTSQTGPLTALVRGAGNQFNRAVSAVGELLPNPGNVPSPSWRNPQGGLEHGGAFATDMALMAPAMTGKALPMALQAAGYSGLTTPGDLEDRLKSAAIGGAASLGGSALGSAFSNLAPRAATAGPAGVLMRQFERSDIVPTPGQVAALGPNTVGNEMLQQGEHMFRALPLAGAMVKRAEKHAAERFSKVAGIEAEEGTVASNAFSRPRTEQVMTGMNTALATQPTTALETGISTGIAALGAWAHIPTTIAVTAGLMAAYTKPVQKAILATMKSNDTLATWLGRNPEFLPLVSNAIAQQQ